MWVGGTVADPSLKVESSQGSCFQQSSNPNTYLSRHLQSVSAHSAVLYSPILIFIVYHFVVFSDYIVFFDYPYAVFFFSVYLRAVTMAWTSSKDTRTDVFRTWQEFVLEGETHQSLSLYGHQSVSLSLGWHVNQWSSPSVTVWVSGVDSNSPGFGSVTRCCLSGSVSGGTGHPAPPDLDNDWSVNSAKGR